MRCELDAIFNPFQGRQWDGRPQCARPAGWCEAEFGLGGVLGHGTHEEDGPVTWEALISPRSSLGEAERRSMTPKPATLISPNVKLPKSCRAEPICAGRGYTSHAASVVIHVQSLRRPEPSASKATRAERSSRSAACRPGRSGTAMGLIRRGRELMMFARSLRVAISARSRIGSNSGIRGAPGYHFERPVGRYARVLAHFRPLFPLRQGK
jgi:hypothetical protein